MKGDSYVRRTSLTAPSQPRPVQKLAKDLQHACKSGDPGAIRDWAGSILVIEHNLDVIRAADSIIDLGPEGGNKGGYVVATGTPERIAKVDASWTGKYLR